MLTLPLARYRSPGAPVLIDADRHIGAGEFFAQARLLAAALPDARFVVNLCESRHAFMLGFAAALLRKQTSLLPPGQGRGDRERVLQQYPGAYLLSDVAQAFAAEAAQGAYTTLDILPYLSHGGGTADSATLTIPDIDQTQHAAILFTSGSTGQPTAHAKTWGQLYRGAAGLAASLNWPEHADCAVVGSVPPQHMYGLETTVMLPWFAGIAVHAAKPLLTADLEAALRLLACQGWWMTTPLHLRAALHPRGPPAALPGLAGIVASTMALPTALAAAAESAWRIPVLEVYGSTETGALATRRTASEDAWVPLRGVTLERKLQAPSQSVEDDHASDTVAAIWATGPHIGAPVQLLDELDFLPEGRFLLLGRSADLIKVGGKRASLTGLNEILLEIPGVDDGALFVPDLDAVKLADGGTPPVQRLAGFYVAASLPPELMLQGLRQRIDPVFMPRPLFRVEALPRSQNGKLTRAALMDLYALCLKQQRGGQPCLVPPTHPALPGHFPGKPIVPGVVVLAQVEQAIRAQYPQLQLAGLLSARFHLPLQFGQACCIHPLWQGEQVRFEVRIEVPIEVPIEGPDTQMDGAESQVVVSGRWACRTAAGQPAETHERGF